VEVAEDIENTKTFHGPGFVRRLIDHRRHAKVKAHASAGALEIEPATVRQGNLAHLRSAGQGDIVILHCRCLPLMVIP
jgi:hypothetical protein